MAHVVESSGSDLLKYLLIWEAFLIIYLNSKYSTGIVQITHFHIRIALVDRSCYLNTGIMHCNKNLGSWAFDDSSV